MNAPTSQPSLFGLSYGWSYAVTSFTLMLCGCLPLALIATMGHTGTGAQRAQALMLWLPIMAVAIAALACAVVFFTVLRQHPQWRNKVFIGMWALSALGMVGWWKL